jgi:hypothetical protein
MNTLSASQYNKRLKPYVGAGVKRATELGNRGPLKLGDGNKLAPDILNAFRKTGFYVFEGLIQAGEIGYLQQISNHYLKEPLSTMAQSRTDTADPHSARNLQGQCIQ